jgi:Xaa-Pro aminopeptidase
MELDLLRTPDYSDRRNRLRQAVGKGLLLLYRGGEWFNENLFYLSGLDTFYTATLISLESDFETVLINPLEYSSISTDFNDQEACIPESLKDRIIQLVKDTGISIVYCDYDFFSRIPPPTELIDNLRHAIPHLSVRPLPPALAHMRQIKDPLEIKTIKKGIQIVKGLMDQLPDMIRPGLPEVDIAAEIYKNLILNGFNRFYDIFVASGANSSLPYYRANNGILPGNSVVLIDICAALDNYVIDMTRTFPTAGSFTPKQEKIYRLIEVIQKKALDNARPGSTLAQLSTEAKKSFALNKLEKYYLNKIGHFVGLSPDDPGDPDTLFETGMVITIEPGLYMYNEGLAIRVEDIIVLD